MAIRGELDGAANGTWQDDGTSGLQGRRVLSWCQWDDYGAGVYDRGAGEGTWKSDQHRLVLSLTSSEPLLLQVDDGPARQVTQALA